jgi:hypothetical protein
MLHKTLLVSRIRMYSFSIDGELTAVSRQFLLPFRTLASYLRSRRHLMGKKPMSRPQVAVLRYRHPLPRFDWLAFGRIRR